MEIRWILCVFILLCPCAYVETACQSRDWIDSCRYTILCENHPGSAANPVCNHDPYVTFQINNSTAEVLTKGFFGSTNFDSRVRAVIAVNNTWSTISSQAFSYYTKTIVMNLSGNRIREIQSEAFKNLFTLNYLNVSFNLLEKLYPRSFLTGEIGVSNIMTLDLSNNLLNNIASDVFVQCANVQVLHLQNNNIANLEDNVFGVLKNLTKLYLQNNKLTALNMALINLKQLKDLDLSHNRISSLSGYETNRLISIESLNMSNNMIKIIESNCFNQAFNLESLDLGNNNITSPIVNLLFMNNSKLTYLNLYNNNISRIQENAFQHNNLFYLNLDKNFISGEITQATFAGLKQIKNITLCKQNITSINANTFTEMTSLVNLNLSANNINVIDPLGFQNTSSLVVLDLSRNNIKYLNFLKDCLMNLTEIYLNNNKIELIQGYAFENQTRLKKIDISNNRINTIEQFSLPLSNLQLINISGNAITGSVKSNVFSFGKYLRYLDLSNLNITRIEDMAFVDIPLLARLNLSYNAIEYVGQNNFLNMNNMFSLDLSNNRLSNINLNGTVMKSLTALYLNNNNLSNITGVIPNLSEIMYLDVSHNNISELTDEAFGTLKKIRVLRAFHNNIKKFNNPQVNLLSKLQDLDLSSNQISMINLSFFKELVRIDISNNVLNNINANLLQNLDSLQVLNIFNNNISEISPGVFQNAITLKVLNISSNNLKNLRYGSLRGLHKTEVIDLSMNNITDIDVEVFHECIELKTLLIDYNHIKDLDVEHLIEVVPKLISLSIGGNPLDCKQIVHSIRNINQNSSRSVEITSIHKIFYEDNVHGISCGNDDLTKMTTVISSGTSNSQAETSYSSALIIWCSVLTICLIVITAGFLFWKRHYSSIGTISQSTLQFRHSVELSGSDYSGNLVNLQ